MTLKRPLSLVLIALLLSHCAAMNQEECVYSDWTAVGYEDGVDGRGSDRFGDYRRACADFGVTPDFAAWQQGRESGLLEYCRPLRGFQEGESGAAYNGVCSSQLEPEFLEAYQRGAELYSLRTQLRTVETQIDSLIGEIARLDQDVADIQSIIIVEETSPEERAELLAEMNELNAQRDELAAELGLLQEDRIIAEEELIEFEYTVNAAGFSI